jgi:hypothetical protein
LKQVLA